MKRVAYITNSSDRSGVGERAMAIAERLEEIGRGEIELHRFQLDGERVAVFQGSEQVLQLRAWPGSLGIKSVGWLRLGTKLLDYLSAHGFDLVHATNQSLGFLAGGAIPTVVTVHDIIELQDPQSMAGRLLAGKLYGELQRADRVITVSDYTAKQVELVFGLRKADLVTIPNGVSKSFYMIDDFRGSIGYRSLLQEYDLPDDARVVLFVGSDHPRKNVLLAWQVFAELAKSFQDLFFFKVGAPGLLTGRRRLLEAISQSGLERRVRIVEGVSAERLNEFYNLAEVLLFPSRFEGFGFPPLQAMAAGTAVVTTNATSIPEVVGNDGDYGARAALVYSPDDFDGLLHGVEQVLNNASMRKSLIEVGLKRARLFKWDDSADDVLEVYRSTLSITGRR